MTRRAATGLVFAALLSTAAAARGEVIDRVVVSVGGEVITESRIRFMQAFLQVTHGQGLGRPLASVEGMSLEDVQRVLEDDAILYGMASRLPIIEVSPDDIRKRIQWFRSQFEDDAAFDGFVEGWGFDRGEQWRFFRRRLAIDAFIALKIGAFATVPERELEAYYQAHADAYDAPLMEVRAKVQADYAAANQARTFEAWMEAYRRNHSDMIHSPGGEPGSTPTKR